MMTKTLLQFVPFLSVGIIMAIMLESLIRQNVRRIVDDRFRIAAASKALASQASLVDQVLKSDEVPSILKDFILDTSSLVDNYKLAKRAAEWIDSHSTMKPVEEDQKETDELGTALEYLWKHDYRTFELVFTTFRNALTTMLLQWPDTARSIWSFSQQLGGPEAAHSSTMATLQAVRVQARHNRMVEAAA